MPELPDVAGFKQYLDATSLHQRVASTECLNARFIKEVSRRSLQQRLQGAELDSSSQWGKWLFVTLSSGGYLVLHFGMTGELSYAAEDTDPHEHTRLALHFDNGYRLSIISQRMIGQASYTDDIQAFAEKHDLGPDALEIDRATFLDLMRGRRGSVKSALMNQSLIAGIGNVYSDEILFQAGLHPASQIKRLDKAGLKNLYSVMHRVLRTAARKGGNGRKAPKTWLLGGRGEESPCPRCGGALDDATVNGRTSWFCPRCQSKP